MERLLPISPPKLPFMDIDDGHGLAQAIVDTLREPLLILDKDLRVVAASRSFYVTFKVKPREVEGRPLYTLSQGQWNIPELKLLLDDILPRHSAMEAYEIEQSFPGLGRRTVLLNARKVLNHGNDRALILLAIEDVTERRTAEREMAELLRQKEILLQEMQHRIANSLQIIASILLIKARTVQSEETRMHLRDAHQRVMSVATVQQQIHVSGRGETIDLANYLFRLCETLVTSMIGDGSPISLKVQAEDASVSSTEAVSIGLIVTELVINALKHAFVGDRTEGVIVVAYNTAGKNWRLTVFDNGIGRLQGQPEATTPGLGTSIVEALAKQLGGRVEISRTSHGTSVSVIHESTGSQIPASEQISPRPLGIDWSGLTDVRATPRSQEEPGLNEHGTSPATAPLGRALIVEDDGQVVFVLTEMLADLGFGIVAATNLDEAMQAVRAPGTFAVALVDLDLPGSSGLEVISDLRQLLPTLPIIIETGYGAMVEADNAADRSRVPAIFLEKPFTDTDLVEALAAAGVSLNRHRKS